MNESATTIAELFYAAVELDLPDALAVKKEGRYVPISSLELKISVERLALAMYDRGLRPGNHVAILAENSPEWAMTDYACAISGLPTATIYATLIASQAAFILNNSKSRWVFCSDQAQLAKVLELWPTLPDLELAVLIQGPVPEAHGHTVLSWSQLMEEGKAQDGRRLLVRQWGLERKPEDLLTLIYTSGTTADPKGAMLSHGNIVSNVHASLKALPVQARDRCLSFLPLTHIFERMAGHYVMLHMGASIYYAESVNSVPENLLEVKPTVLCSVPRIYEKIFAKVMNGVAGSGWPKHQLFHWAYLVGQQVVPLLYQGKKPTGWLALRFAVAKALVFSKIKAHTGGQIRFAVSGGAPLMPKVMEFFWAIGLPILEGYGLTETSPVITANRLGKVGPGTVGNPLYDTWDGKPFVKIADDGEILCHGPNVMLGYWDNEAATKEAIDTDGYFHTGDIGEFDALGRLKITDRKKELIITSGGKKIAPQPIENELKTDKYVSQAVLAGDKRNFISALIVPNFDSLERWAGYKHLHFANRRELVEQPIVMAKLMSRVEKVNATLSNYERIKKIVIIPDELTVENGALTPSLKIKRRVVNQMYGGLIEGLYEVHKGESEAH
ncbi:MAG: long-chain fatty acid--CoA ligase [Holophagaceae bacterium]|nr:long-chain fatty acid--CoA ligase [Holophagaceae bacterium]